MKSGGNKGLDGVKPMADARAVRLIHLPLMVLSGLLLVAGRLVPLPFQVCMFQRLTGYPCPFCGYTRAFWMMSCGDWRGALAECPLAIAVYLSVLLFFLWNVHALIRGRRWLPYGRIWRFAGGYKIHVFVLIGLLIVANWVYRLARGLL